MTSMCFFQNDHSSLIMSLNTILNNDNEKRVRLKIALHRVRLTEVHTQLFALWALLYDQKLY